MCRPQKREVTYFLGLLLLAVAFGIKRWRYLRSRRAEEEYEKRRWGQAKPVNDVCPCCNSSNHAMHGLCFLHTISHLHSDASAHHCFAEQTLCRICLAFNAHEGQSEHEHMQVGYPLSHLDSKEYQLALARTRQAMHVHKAVEFMNTSNTAR